MRGVHRRRRRGAIGAPALSVLTAGTLVGSLLAVLAPASATPIVTGVVVANGADDGEESPAGSVKLTSSDLELVRDGSGDQTVGIRFVGVQVPAGATVSAAHIQFQADEIDSEPTSLQIQAWAIDDAPALPTSPYALSSPARTLAAATWNPAPWTAIGDRGPAQQSSDVSAVLQEIVSRPGWAPGNAIVFVITGTGRRVADSYDGSASGAPRLHIEYTAAAPPDCEYWVSPAGSDLAGGSRTQPWATVTHAAAVIPDAACTVWVEDGVYGAVTVERRFASMTVFRAVNRYRAVFEASTTVFDLDGVRNVTFQGFEMRHAGPGSTGYVAIVDRDNPTGVWAEDVVLRDNIFHDSYDNDLLKVHSGVRNARIEGNVFYNQGPIEQHMDVNSVTDVVIEGNLFFNDFARSGRTNPGTTKHYIVVKDSGGADDGLLGSRRVVVRRNVFMNWEGGNEALIQVGNDGKPYYEADDVSIENNLFLGNGPNRAQTTLGIAGSRNVSFVNNTILGDHPSAAYGFRLDQKGENPVNDQITIAGNIWSDPTGTMDEFSAGDPASVSGLTLAGNLYWNGGSPIGPGTVAGPGSDPTAILADPLIEAASVTEPYWTGSAFLSGTTTIVDEFTRVIGTHGPIPSLSPAVDRADPALAPPDDITGLARDGTPDIGAFEATGPGAPIANPDSAITDEDSSVVVDVLANDSDASGLPLSVSGLTQPGHGTVNVDAGGVRYTPATDFNGNDSFTYRASNGASLSAPVSVELVILPVNDPPTAGDDSATTAVDAAVVIDVLANDGDPDGDSLAVLDIDSSLSAGTVARSGTALEYTPPAGFTGIDEFFYTATDGTAVSPPARVTVTVEQPAVVEVLPISEVSISGSVVAGSLGSLSVSDNQYEQIREVLSGGKPSKRTSQVEHHWTFDLTTPGPSELQVEAHRSTNTEGDDFRFELSTDGGATWTALLTVSKSSDDNTPQVAPLPPGTAGPIVIRVVDTDRTAGRQVLDTVLIDRMMVVVSPGTPPPVSVTISASDPQGSEAGDPASVTITRSSGSEPLTVFYTVAGTAVPGSAAGSGDYLSLSGSASFAAGVLQANVAIEPFQDEEIEGPETVILTLAAGAGYTVGTPSTATVTIVDDDAPAPVTYVSTSETPTYGLVTLNDHRATHLSDGVREVIAEEAFGNGKRHRLEHRWSFDVTAGGTLEFVIRAYTPSGEPFAIEYSLDGSTWAALTSVTDITDPGTFRIAALPAGVSGTVTVRASDVDRGRNDAVVDSLVIDFMAIRSGF